MTKLLALTLWALAFTAALFVLAPAVWRDVPLSLLYFSGVALLGVIGPLGI
jgi:hypothetical protein